MTENFWQLEKERIRLNKDNIHPVIQQTYDDKQALVPNKNFRELYYNCMQGHLNIKSWERSDDLTLDDMGMLICRGVGCELQYCQASMLDPYEKTFENCDDHIKKFYQCQEQEKRRYIHDGQGRTLQQQIVFMFEQKKKEKKHGVNVLEQKLNRQIQTDLFNKEKDIAVKENENANRPIIVMEQKL